MEKKTSLTGPVITGSSEKQAPDPDNRKESHRPEELFFFVVIKKKLEWHVYVNVVFCFVDLIVENAEPVNNWWSHS